MHLLAFLLGIFLAASQHCLAQSDQPQPDTPPTLKLGSFTEFSRDPTFQYTLNYAVLEVSGCKIQYDHFNNPTNYQRMWINPHTFTIVESEDFVFRVSPGFSVSNNLAGQTDWLFGADVEYGIPAARVQILQRSYKGNHFDHHYLFSTWQPVASEDQLLLMHFMNMNSEGPSTSYVGPAANLLDGRLFLWVGPSLTKNATWATSVQFTIDF